MPATGQGNAENVRYFSGWSYFRPEGEDVELSLGYTQGGYAVDMSSETTGIPADQASEDIITVATNSNKTITAPLMEWTPENMELALPGGEVRTDAQNRKYVALTSSNITKKGSFRIHPIDKKDNDFSGETFFPNVSISPNTSYTIDGENAQILTLEMTATAGRRPIADRDGDVAYYDYLPQGAIIHVTGVTVTPSTLALTVGARGLVEAEVTPASATDKQVTWVSSDPEIAEVSPDGEVYAKSAGTVTITGTTRDGAFTGECAVTVS